ncbi:MAG: AAA family ATPase [Planctomycetota bacterium]
MTKTAPAAALEAALRAAGKTGAKTPPKRARRMMTMLVDPKVKLPARKRLLLQVCMNDEEEADRIVEELLAAAAASSEADLHRQRREELDETIEALQAGPQRAGVVIDQLPASHPGPRRAHVRLQDGTSLYPVVPEVDLGLARGDLVLLSGRGEAVTARDPLAPETGEEARLESWSDGRVAVTVRGEERHLLYAAAPLRARLEAGEVARGALLLACPRRGIAWDVAPEPDDARDTFRFLCREPVPDVVVERDVADPPAFIDDLAAFCRAEMTDPSRRRAYRLRRARTLLLTGVSGSGKTLSIMATIRRLYEVMAEVTGIPVDELPPRVLRLRMSKLLSKWLGESDRNADRLVDEIEALSAVTVTGPNGTFELPVIVLFEEVDGIARARGEDHEQVYDRIQTTLLQRLDHTANPVLRERLVVILATSNIGHLVDPAWLRRVGGETWRFGRLRRRGFAAVLDTHLRDRPIATTNGQTPEAARREIVSATTAALFSPNGSDAGVVEVSLAGVGAPEIRTTRDFLTGSIVDRAVEAAGERVCRDGADGGPDGLTVEGVLRAIDEQVGAVVGQLTPANAASYVDLPDGTRPVNVRRVHRDPGAGASRPRDWQRP